MDPVAVAVRLMPPEMARTVIGQEVSLARRDSVDVPVLSNPHEVAAALLHDILAAERILVEGGKAASRGVADPLGLLPA